MKRVRKFHNLLYERYCDLEWWPAETPFEVILGAILTQNTNWKNVESALDNMRNLGLLEPKALLLAEMDVIKNAIRPSGYYNQKAFKIVRFMEWFDEIANCSIAALDTVDTTELRNALLSIKGIGPETADDILLYAFQRPVFVVDTYTYRIAVRHGWTPPDITYDALAEMLSSAVDNDINLMKNFHAMIVEVGKNYCKKRKPDCEYCPGKTALPENGPAELF